MLSNHWILVTSRVRSVRADGRRRKGNMGIRVPRTRKGEGCRKGVKEHGISTYHWSPHLRSHAFSRATEWPSNCEQPNGPLVNKCRAFFGMILARRQQLPGDSWSYLQVNAEGNFTEKRIISRGTLRRDRSRYATKLTASAAQDTRHNTGTISATIHRHSPFTRAKRVRLVYCIAALSRNDKCHRSYGMQSWPSPRGCVTV